MDKTIKYRDESNIDCTTSNRPMNTYEMITDKIIEKMKTGQVPWRKPWKYQPPRNLVSKRTYHGINLLLLTFNEYESPYYVTFYQAKQLGGSIKKGKHGTPVVFWKLLQALNNDSEIMTKRQKLFPTCNTQQFLIFAKPKALKPPMMRKQSLRPLRYARRSLRDLLINPIPSTHCCQKPFISRKRI